ncbi:MAG: hypothetical protein ACRDY6_04120 [Acidimicrobiia bacterium]
MRSAEGLETRLEAGNVRSERRVGKDMLAAERAILRNLVALDVFDQYISPHQQLQRDATRLQLAIDALEAGNPASARDDFVRRVSLTNAGRPFAYETYVAELARHDPGFDRLQWGSQAHLAPYVDVWQEYHSIGAKVDEGKTDPADYAEEIASLGTKVDEVYGRLNERLRGMARTFDEATASVERATSLAG